MKNKLKKISIFSKKLNIKFIFQLKIIINQKHFFKCESLYYGSLIYLCVPPHYKFITHHLLLFCNTQQSKIIIKYN